MSTAKLVVVTPHQQMAREKLCVMAAAPGCSLSGFFAENDGLAEHGSELSETVRTVHRAGLANVSHRMGWALEVMERVRASGDIDAKYQELVAAFEAAAAIASANDKWEMGDVTEAFCFAEEVVVAPGWPRPAKDQWMLGFVAEPPSKEGYYKISYGYTFHPSDAENPTPAPVPTYVWTMDCTRMRRPHTSLVSNPVNIVSALLQVASARDAILKSERAFTQAMKAKFAAAPPADALLRHPFGVTPSRERRFDAPESAAVDVGDEELLVAGEKVEALIDSTDGCVGDPRWHLCELARSPPSS